MADRREAIDAVRVADERWVAALDATEYAPPDPGFAERLRNIADAAEQQAAALGLAQAADLGWNPMPGARQMQISHEMRPGGNRPGPPELWLQFDRAVERLGIAMEGVALSAVTRGYSELSDVARQLATELSRSASGRQRRAS